MTMKSMSRSELADLHLSLLELERKEERKRQRQLTTDLTLKLVVESVDSELDAYFLTVGHESKRRLPKHCIDQGSQVSVSLSPIVNWKGGAVQDISPFAVVTEVTPFYLTLIFSNKPNISTGMTVFIKPTESKDHTQLSGAMKWLKNVKTNRANHSDEPAVPVVREMFKEHQQEPAAPGPDVPHADEASPPCFIDRRLNVSQREAVKLALRDRRLAVIHGPPGTGKTITVVEVILQHVQRGQHVLVCAPSNKAVDNLLEGLWKQTREATCGLSMVNVLRLGNLARMDEKHRQFSPKLQLDIRIKMREHRRTAEQRDIESESEDDLASEYIEFECIDEDLEPSLFDMMLAGKREINMPNLLKDAFVVIRTLTSVRSVQLYRTYDLLVIDECAQAIEAACWLAIPLARKVLLTGDPCQLPPTIRSQNAARGGLAVSLMERQMKLHGEGVVHMLDTQYRMHELIQAWSSWHLYGGRLKAAPKVGSRLLTELPNVRSTKQTQPTLLLVDTDGCKLKETRDAKTNSYHNNGEATLVVSHARSLVEAGVRAEDIGVITPYKQQVTLIAGKMSAAGLDVEVNSVDGYQGREKEAILLSLVRSNAHHQVGFVGDRRRLNVAVTRARRHLFVVCDTATMRCDTTIRSLVKHMEQNGEACSAYCNQCPRSKDGYSADDDDDDVDAVNDDVNADDFSRLDRTMARWD